MEILEEYLYLLQEGHHAYLATVNPNGTPQCTPVWITYNHPFVEINTAKGRRKYKNIMKNPWVSIVVSDKNNFYKYMAIKGKVEKIIDEQNEAREHIRKLGITYTGQPFEPPKEEVRVILRIKIERVSYH